MVELLLNTCNGGLNLKWHFGKVKEGIVVENYGGLEFESLCSYFQIAIVCEFVLELPENG